MKTLYYLPLLLALGLTVAAQDNKRIKINGNAIQLIDVTNGADQCPNKTGVTVRLKVAGSAVDVIRYMSYKNSWMPFVYTDQAAGSEFTAYACNKDASFQFYTRTAGSTEVFPKP